MNGKRPGLESTREGVRKALQEKAVSRGQELHRDGASADPGPRVHRKGGDAGRGQGAGAACTHGSRKTHHPEPAAPLLSIHPKAVKPGSPRDTCPLGHCSVATGAKMGSSPSVWRKVHVRAAESQPASEEKAAPKDAATRRAGGHHARTQAPGERGGAGARRGAPRARTAFRGPGRRHIPGLLLGPPCDRAPQATTCRRCGAAEKRAPQCRLRAPPGPGPCFCGCTRCAGATRSPGSMQAPRGLWARGSPASPDWLHLSRVLPEALSNIYSKIGLCCPQNAENRVTRGPQGTRTIG